MATTAPHSIAAIDIERFELAQQALIDAFGADTSAVLSHVVDTASQHAPDSLVREALWNLMSHGVITTDSRGNLNLHATA